MHATKPAVSLASIVALLTAAGAAVAADRLHVRDLDLGTARVSTWETAKNAGGVAQGFSIHLADGRSVVVEDADFRLGFMTGAIDPLRDAPPVIPAALAAADTGMYVVQFVTQAIDEYRDAIGAAGGEILHYFPQNAYIVHMSAETRAAVEALPFVRWVGDIQPAHKIDGDITIKNWGFLLGPDNFRTRTANFMERTPDEAGRLPYRVGFHRAGLDVMMPVVQLIEQMGGTTCGVWDDTAYFNAALTPDMLLAVARLPWVSHLTPGGEGGPDMNNARILGGANYIATQNGPGNPPTGYNGEGVRAEVFDSGIRTTHVDLVGVLNRNGVGVDSHGTACYGINFGTGVGNPSAKGLLPAREQGIFSGVNSYLNSAVGCVVTAGVASRLAYTDDLVDPAQPYKAVYQQSSSGSERVFNYCPISQNMDNVIFNTDLLICQSQSNAGNQDSRPEAWAKNIVSGGGITHQNDANWGNDSWTSASVGYSEDGRTKPDLSAFYDSVWTTTSTSDTAYTTGFNGTSSATPIVAGHFGLFFEMWHQGIFGNPTGATVFDSRPHAMTAKAFMINTARQWTYNTWTTGGAEPNLSRRKQGWGFPQLNNVFDLRNKCFVVNETDALQNLETATYHVNVAAAEPALKVTMCYMDPPPTTIVPSQHRVNNLNLKVTDPNGDSVYWGNWGLGDQRAVTGSTNWAGGVNPPSEGMWSLPGGAANLKDTVENVFIQNPIAGRWTIEVIAAEVVRDAVPHGFGTPPSGPVDVNFALVVTGAVAANCPGDTNGDNIVNFADLNAILSNFGLTSGATLAQGDVDGDGDVDFADLNVVLGLFGTVC